MILMGNRKKYVSQILGDKKDGASKEAPIQTIANELIEAIHSHDTDAVVACLRSFMTHLNAEPSQEAEHVDIE